MYRILMIECACEGLLTVNGQFCGPLEAGGQAFPMSEWAQAYIQMIAYDPQIRPLAAVMELREGKIVRLEPKERCFALMWPDGVIQLELRPQEDDTQMGGKECAVQPNTLLRYLSMAIAGDARAKQLLMRAQDEISVLEYSAAVPLRFAPSSAPAQFDERAGLVRRVAANIAAVDTALAATVSAGQGRRMIERIEILRT